MLAFFADLGVRPKLSQTTVTLYHPAQLTALTIKPLANHVARTRLNTYPRHQLKRQYRRARQPHLSMNRSPIVGFPTHSSHEGDLVPSPMMARVLRRRLLLLAAVLAVAAVTSLPRPASAVRPFVLVLSGEDFLKDSAAHPSLPSGDSAGADEWDDFADESPTADPLLSPSSWVPILDPASPSASDDEPDSTADALFVAGARAMISAASAGDEAAFATSAAQIEAAAAEGHPGAQSALAFLSGAGITRPGSRSRAFLLHKFAADGGDLQSKMALAYSYFRQEVR
jgi:hypothetical protein